MGLFSAIASFASKALSAVGSFATKLGLSPLSALGIIGMAVSAIAKALGLLKPEDKIEEMGEKALQAGEKGIKPENYKSFEEYKKDYDKFKPDPKVRHSDEDRLAAGIDHLQRSIEAKRPEFKDMDRLYPLMAAKKDFFTGERLESYANTAKTENFDLGSIKGYFDGTSSFKEKKATEDFLHKAEKNFNPAYNKDEFGKNLADMAANTRAAL